MNSSSLVAFLTRVHGFLDVKKNNKLFALFGLIVFVAGLFVAIGSLKGDVDFALDPIFLASMGLLLCLTFVLNVLRTHCHSRVVGARLSLADNARIALFSSAMNMLPFIIPAGLAFRFSNLVQHGGKPLNTGRLIAANYLLALITSIAFGVLALAPGQGTAWYGLAVAGVILYLVSIGTLLSVSGRKPGLAIVIIEAVAVLSDAFRILICFGLMGFAASYQQTVLLTCSAILGSAVSVVPAGLGIREIAGAALSPLVDLNPAQTYLAIALNRVFGLIFFVGLALITILFVRGPARES